MEQGGLGFAMGRRGSDGTGLVPWTGGQSVIFGETADGDDLTPSRCAKALNEVKRRDMPERVRG